MKPILTIAIPTIEGRESQFNTLQLWLLAQNVGGFAKIISEKDNKEMAIGAKRQLLLDKCDTEYIVQIDDDDNVPMDYISEIRKALETKPDCIGYLEEIRPSGKIACHSNEFSQWHGPGLYNKETTLRRHLIMPNDERFGPDYHYLRTIFHKDVIKTDIARQIGLNTSLRFAEDHDFSIRLKQSGLLKNEVFIDKIMYYYNDPGYMTEQQKNERYGII